MFLNLLGAAEAALIRAAASTQPLGGFLNPMRILVCIALVLVAGASYAQHPAAKFDEFGDIYCDDEKARLDNFANQLRVEPDATGYIIFYGGRHHDPHGKSRSRLPLWGEAEARVARMKPYIINTRTNFDAARIVVMNGGYRDSWMAELWIVPKGEKPPIPTPTVDSKAIKFRRGRVRKRDYYCTV